MASCKDCLHYDVCQFHIDEETKMTVNECEHFKDRNRFVELPSTALPIKIFLADNINGSFALRDYYFDSRNQKLMMTIYGFDVHKYFSQDLTDFGKTVFLTREEAEQALKGRENNG